MKKLSKDTLSLLSLLIIVGFTIVITTETYFNLLGYATILMGAFALRTLIQKNKEK